MTNFKSDRGSEIAHLLLSKGYEMTLTRVQQLQVKGYEPTNFDPWTTTAPVMEVQNAAATFGITDLEIL
jgi:hypothetical protein